MTEPYDLQVSASAAWTIQYKLPEGVAAAVIEFITGTLLENPHRVGKALRYEPDGVRSVRRGAFRVLYEIERREPRGHCAACRSPGRCLPRSLS